MNDIKTHIIDINGNVIDITIWLNSKLNGIYTKKVNQQLVNIIYDWFVFKKMEMQYNPNHTIEKACKILDLIN